MTEFIKIKLNNGKDIIINKSTIREVGPVPDGTIGQCIITVPHGPQMLGYQVMHTVTQIAEALEAYDLVTKTHDSINIQ